MISSFRLVGRIARVVERLASHYELSGQERYEAATHIAVMAKRYEEMHALLKRLRNTVEATDGTTIENEKIVDAYRALMQRLDPP